jgi:RimJ/RimL family protein N-acetyltransferase
MQVFDFDKDYILEDEHVLLRPLKSSDYDNLLPFSLNEPTLWQYSIQQANTEEKLLSYINNALEKRKNLSEYPFIVFDKKTNQYAGSTRFYDIQLKDKTLQLGYTWYGKDFQGTGLNKHCKFLLLQFAFDEIEMERVEFRSDNNNARSIAAMRSIGCTVEGVLRQHVLLFDGNRRDSIILSILKSEWNNTVKNNLLQKL